MGEKTRDMEKESRGRGRRAGRGYIYWLIGKEKKGEKWVRRAGGEVCMYTLTYGEREEERKRGREEERKRGREEERKRGREEERKRGREEERKRGREEEITIEYQIPNPKSQIPNPKSQIPNPKSQIPNPKSQIPNPKSQISNIQSTIQAYLRLFLGEISCILAI
ncbi:hypothetical protein EAE99_002629 [Botrytis elliptica]|nr:hypothetical protein EAE99_002629 [Botrytis elliptica]